MAHIKKGQTPKKETGLIKNQQKKVCELIISNFLMMSASTLEVPVQKSQVNIAAGQFAKARDILNAHVKISTMNECIILEKDNAQTTGHEDNYEQPLKSNAATRENKIVVKPRVIKKNSKKKNPTQLLEAPSQNQCEEIINRFLATKITEKRTVVIQQFANAEIPIANANSQKQINSDCIVQDIEINFSEDSRKSAVLAFIKARDRLKAQVKIRFSKNGIVLVRAATLKKRLEETPTF